MPESVRGRVLEHCPHGHGVKLHVHAAVIMPDHVHMLLTPLVDVVGNPYALAEIMNGVKGASATRSTGCSAGKDPCGRTSRSTISCPRMNGSRQRPSTSARIRCGRTWLPGRRIIAGCGGKGLRGRSGSRGRLSQIQIHEARSGRRRKMHPPPQPEVTGGRAWRAPRPKR